MKEAGEKNKRTLQLYSVQLKSLQGQKKWGVEKEEEGKEEEEEEEKGKKKGT